MNCALTHTEKVIELEPQKIKESYDAIIKDNLLVL